VGVECDVAGVVAATRRTRPSMIHVSEFFSWAQDCREQFECAAGNPPFIRYQHFAGQERQTALRLCSRLGAKFSGLSSSWAPYLVACASLLKPDGRMAFVVPAEIGHAPYARPLISYVTRSFRKVAVVAVRQKLFPELSEDVWLLYAEGFGGKTDRIVFSQAEAFKPTARPPASGEAISVSEWESWNVRLRPMLLPHPVRELYAKLRRSPDTVPLGKVARVGIGYVTGANEFFHLAPSTARRLRIPDRYLTPCVRNGRSLTGEALTASRVQSWLERDEPVLLLRLRKDEPVMSTVQDYLDSPAGREARRSFKCRNRHPWYVVPDVRIPDAFLSYMSGEGPQLVANKAACSCTNSIHAVSLKDGWKLATLETMWDHPLARLSCEVEGHPLGGGMLKVEPGECARILLPRPSLRCSAAELRLLEEGIATMRRWRHYE
jgi:adenine-specific DNA-methyltransferase